MTTRKDQLKALRQAWQLIETYAETYRWELLDDAERRTNHNEIIERVKQSQGVGDFVNYAGNQIRTELKAYGVETGPVEGFKV